MTGQFSRTPYATCTTCIPAGRTLCVSFPSRCLFGHSCLPKQRFYDRPLLASLNVIPNGITSRGGKSQPFLYSFALRRNVRGWPFPPRYRGKSMQFFDVKIICICITATVIIFRLIKCRINNNYDTCLISEAFIWQ